MDGEVKPPHFRERSAICGVDESDLQSPSPEAVLATR